jgi:nucleoid DNA-binding protein
VTHAQFVEKVARAMGGAPSLRVRRTLAAFTHVLLAEVGRYGRVVVPGLGTFSRGTRKARVIRNPATKELMELPRMVTVKFTAAKAAKEKVR